MMGSIKRGDVLSSLIKVPITFITNFGQMDSKVKYYIKGGEFGFYFTKEEVVLSFIKGTSKKIINKNSNQSEIFKEEDKIGVAIAMQFIDTSPDLKIEGQIKGDGRVNYLKGNNTEKWYRDVPIYERVVYKEIWKGIDLVFYGGRTQLKYEFIVYPGADFKDIKLSYKGSDDIFIDDEGNLLIKTELGALVDKAPVSYQEIEGKRIMVDSGFKLKNHENMGSICSFEIEKTYNSDYPIIIDPGLIYSTYLGGSASDQGGSIAVDSSGNIYVTGITSSVNFPTTLGVFQPVFGGGFSDVFVTKLNAEGTNIIYSTYLGGSNAEFSFGITVNNMGNAYVTGGTSSLDFPVTLGAFQPVFGGGPQDVFVTKLNTEGTGLIYSTYLGGSAFDSSLSIKLDNVGNAYITGNTNSANFPTTLGVFQPGFGGGIQNVFIAKLNAEGTALIYSTYLGGSGSDSGTDIAIDNRGNVYVVGQTTSLDFPITAGAFQPVFGGELFDVFVTKLNAEGTGLIYSTYLGGSNRDRGFGIAIDNEDNAYVTGDTESIDFPITLGAFQPNFSGGVTDAFVTKLNATGTGLIYSTYLGGSNSELGVGIAVDNRGNAYVVGSTQSTDFPTTLGAFQQNLGGSADVFVTRLNAEGTGLIYSTYLGGSNVESAGRIAIDTKGNAYVTGRTLSSNFPITIGAFQQILGGDFDAFVSKINTNLLMNS